MKILNIKKIILLIIIIFTTLLTFNSLNAYTNKDLDAANFLANSWLIKNYSKNPEKYELDKNLSRQELVFLIIESNKIKIKDNCENIFLDLKSTFPNKRICRYAETLEEKGIISKTKYFRPEANTTNAETIALVVKSFFNGEYKYDNSKKTSWEEQIVAFARTKNIVPNSYISFSTYSSRGFIYQTITNAIKYKEEENKINNETDNNKFNDADKNSIFDNNINKENDLTNEKNKELICERYGICESEKINVPNNGNLFPIIGSKSLNVSINNSYNQTQIAPTGGNIKIGKLELTAYGGDIEVSLIKFKRGGLGDVSDINKIYLEKNGNRLTNSSNIGSDGIAELIFNPKIKINSGTTETLDIIIEISNNAKIGNEHNFLIKSLNDIKANGKIQGDFPIETGLLRISSYKVEGIDIYFIKKSYSYNGTQNNAVLGEFKIKTYGDKNHIFKKITLKNSGDANIGTNLSNIKIYRDGKDISYDYSINGRDLTIKLYDEIKNGETSQYEIIADIIRWDKKGEKYIFELKSNLDLDIEEKDTGIIPNINIKN